MKGLAYYEQATDTIHNCTQGTLIWWHEKGHQWFYKKGLATQLGVVSTYSLIGTVVFILNKNNTLAGISCLICLTTILVEEIFAWIYAIYKNNSQNKQYKKDDEE